VSSYEPGADVGVQVGVGVRWKLLSQGTSQVVRFATAIVIAHALTPHEYGLAGLAVVLTALVVIFSDLALGAAIVQRWDLREEHRSTVFWLTIGTGLVLSGAGAALAWPLARFYGEPRLAPLFAALSLSFVVTALGATHYALLHREMAFRALEIRQVVVVLVGAVVAIAAALDGLGAWAIVLQQLVLAGVASAMAWGACRWRPRPVVSMTALRELGSFSVNIFVQRLVAYADGNVASLVIGRALGAATLGLFQVGTTVMLSPLTRIAHPMQDVLYPALTRLQHEPRRLAGAWFRAARLIAAITTPAMLGLIVVAPDFVLVVLGRQWTGATTIVRILAWVGLHTSLQSLNSIVLQARYRTGSLLRFQLLSLAANVAGLAIGIRWGITGVAVAYAVSTTLVAPVYAVVTARCAETPVLSFVRTFAGVGGAALAMAALVAGGRIALIAAGVGPTPRLALLVAGGGAAFVALLRLLDRATVDDAIGLVRPLLESRRGRPAPTPASV
jgi:O-antigen/teichoic acid export membrane protein